MDILLRKSMQAKYSYYLRSYCERFTCFFFQPLGILGHTVYILYHLFSHYSSASENMKDTFILPIINRIQFQISELLKKEITNYYARRASVNSQFANVLSSKEGKNLLR